MFGLGLPDFTRSSDVSSPPGSRQTAGGRCADLQGGCREGRNPAAEEGPRRGAVHSPNITHVSMGRWKTRLEGYPKKWVRVGVRVLGYPTFSGKGARTTHPPTTPFSPIEPRTPLMVPAGRFPVHSFIGMFVDLSRIINLSFSGISLHAWLLSSARSKWCC